jgi:hypothetical protein
LRLKTEERRENYKMNMWVGDFIEQRTNLCHNLPQISAEV